MSGTRKELRIVISSLILAASTPLAALAQDEVVEEPVPNTRENMYRTIVDRNPFGLKPPPPVQPVETPVVKPKTDIKLTGITAFNGQLKAYFMSTPQGGPAPGKGAQQQQQQPEYFVLGVDEKKDELEVLGIDYGNRSVRVRSEGIETVFDFEKNGVQAPQVVAPPAPGAHAPPGTPGANAAGGIPGATPFNNNSGAVPVPGTPPPLNNSVRPIPSRIPRTPQVQPDNTMMYQGGNAGYTGYSGGGSYGGQPVQHPVESNLTPEQQIILMEAQKAVNPNIQFPPTPGMPGQGGPPPIPGGRPLPPLPGQ